MTKKRKEKKYVDTEKFIINMAWERRRNGEFITLDEAIKGWNDKNV